MKTCPCCRGVYHPAREIPDPFHRDIKCAVCTDPGCPMEAVPVPLEAWDALPRVAPNAEALVDDYRMAIGDAGEDDARDALLRACVIDAAEVAALRVQRDEAVAGLREIAEHGTRHDLNPSMCMRHDDVDGVHVFYTKYMQGMDGTVRNMAKASIERATGVPEAELRTKRCTCIDSAEGSHVCPKCRAAFESDFAACDCAGCRKMRHVPAAKG